MFDFTIAMGEGIANTDKCKGKGKSLGIQEGRSERVNKRDLIN